MFLSLDDAETITQHERRDVLILAERPDLTVTWSRYAAGEPGPDLHVHREHVDAFYVLEGELTFVVGPAAERVRVPGGGFVAVPPNVVHTYDNDGTAESRWLNMHAPEKGFADYLRALRDGTDAVFDSFDPPTDGGRPAAAVVIAGPGEGERLDDLLLKAALPELCVAERAGRRLPGHDRALDAFYALDGERVLHIRAPDAGFVGSLR